MAKNDLALKGRIRILGGKPFLQRSDRITSNLIRCKRRGQKLIYINEHIGINDKRKEY